MKVVMIGTGYVGLVTGTCFANVGNDVTCVDIDVNKVEQLRQGQIPIYEPGLTEMVLQNVRDGRLQFTTDVSTAVPNADCVFIAVGTPQDDDGSADLQYVFAAAESIADHLSEDTIVIIKSTVPVGTNRAVMQRLSELTGREVRFASNPEFLKEGCAIDDFVNPDRVVVGVSQPDIATTMRALYEPILNEDRPFLVMGLESAEMAKYVANCMLATKISFINEMANLCERVGADINDVRTGIGHDQRIGFSFLYPGAGYGGSCFPKDVKALIATGAENESATRILDAVHAVNNDQKSVLFEKLSRHFGDALSDATIAIWGLAFKPQTDDIREAPALVLLDALLKAGATVRVHDPVAMENVQHQISTGVTYCDDQYEATEQADALVIVTEWDEYRSPDFARLQSQLITPVIFDGRNLFDPSEMAQRGFFYHGIGLQSVNPMTGES